MPPRVTPNLWFDTEAALEGSTASRTTQVRRRWVADCL